MGVRMGGMGRGLRVCVCVIRDHIRICAGYLVIVCVVWCAKAAPSLPCLCDCPNRHRILTCMCDVLCVCMSHLGFGRLVGHQGRGHSFVDCRSTRPPQCGRLLVQQVQGGPEPAKEGFEQIMGGGEGYGWRFMCVCASGVRGSGM